MLLLNIGEDDWWSSIRSIFYIEWLGFKTWCVRVMYWLVLDFSFKYIGLVPIVNVFFTVQVK